MESGNEVAQPGLDAFGNPQQRAGLPAAPPGWSRSFTVLTRAHSGLLPLDYFISQIFELPYLLIDSIDLW